MVVAWLWLWQSSEFAGTVNCQLLFADGRRMRRAVRCAMCRWAYGRVLMAAEHDTPQCTSAHGLRRRVTPVPVCPLGAMAEISMTDSEHAVRSGDRDTT